MSTGFKSLDARNKWFYKVGLCLVAFASWTLAFKATVVQQAPMSQGGLASIAAAVVSAALLLLYDRIRLKGFVIFCIAASTLILAALLSGHGGKTLVAALFIVAASGLVAFMLGDKADRDTEEKTIRIRRFW